MAHRTPNACLISQGELLYINALLVSSANLSDICFNGIAARYGMTDQLKRFSVQTSEASYVVEAEAVRIGDDVLVYIWGGEKPHIGAVAAAQPRPSLLDPDKTSATASVLSYVGHKEDGVVKDTAEILAAALNTNVVVTAGIHWDDLPPGGIDAVVACCRQITEKLEAALTAAD